MMNDIILLPIILSGILGFAFFITDRYNEKIHLHPSLIAGFSIAYFFLNVLPEIARSLPELHIDIPFLDFLFVFFGTIYAHISEKLIIQKVALSKHKKAKELIGLESQLDLVEMQLAEFLAQGFIDSKMDMTTAKDIAETLQHMRELEKDVEFQANAIKKTIHDEVNDSLEKYHNITEFAYHYIIGILIFGLLSIHLLTGLLFFVFAFLMATLGHSRSKMRIFTDLDIDLDYFERGKKNVFLALAAPLGIVTSMILELVTNIELDLIFFLYSFIAGAILYNMMREVIPEKEKGKPVLFVIGVAVFSVVIIILQFVAHIPLDIF